MFKASSISFIIITSVQNVRWGGGGGEVSKVDVLFFKNFKRTILFPAKSPFYCFFICTLFLGGGGGLQKEYFLYTHEKDDEKMDDP